MLLTTRTKLLTACLAGSVILAACGGSGSSSDSNNPGTETETGIEVTGTATAPTGAVAMLTSHSWLIAARDLLVSPARAAITGLEPVEGATVELIRVDDTGAQVGDVLATTTTSISGDYTLTLPAGVNLGGDLIVRITGNGGTEMRAQVVEQDVDINPVSEFVLQKFIEQGADLDNLETDSVVKLTGQVEEFDFTAGADLSAMFAALEQEAGDFVEDQIEVIDATPGSAETVAGNYRGLEVALGLHDDDQQHGVGTVSLDGDLFEFALADQGAGAVELAFGVEESHWSNQTFFQNGASSSLSHFTEVDTGDDGDTEEGQLDATGVLRIESDFEEDIDGDFGWRFPPALARLQKTANSNIFIGTLSDAGVRYLTVDTNDDGVKDAVDPDAREGDEVFKSVLIVAEQPATMTTADLSGDYGRVYFETLFNAGGFFNFRVEDSVISFDGIGSLDISETSIYERSRSSGYSTLTDPAESGIPYSVSDNGSVFTAGGEDEDSLFSVDFGLMAIHSVSTVDDNVSGDEKVDEVMAGTTLAVKLPSAQLDISGRVYRFFFMGVSVDGGSTALATGRFGNTLTVNSDGVSGTASIELIEAEKASSTAEVEASGGDEETLDADITLAPNGAATVVVSSPDGAFTLNGFLAEDGSLGIFHSRYADTGADPDELGVVMLVEIASGE